MKKTSTYLGITLMMLTSTQLSGCFLLAAGAVTTAATTASDRRDLGTQVNDNTIELRLGSRLNQTTETTNAHIVVVSHNYNILLAGEVPNQAAKDKAEALAKQEPGANKVWNMLQIMPNTGPGVRSSDILTTGRVKAGLVQIDMPYFDPTKVNVTTVNGVVYLMGQVTQAEAAQVKNLARSVAGVQGVVALFEISPDNQYL